MTSPTLAAIIKAVGFRNAGERQGVTWGQENLNEYIFYSVGRMKRRQVDYEICLQWNMGRRNRDDWFLPSLFSSSLLEFANSSCYLIIKFLSKKLPRSSNGWRAAVTSAVTGFTSSLMLFLSLIQRINNLKLVIQRRPIALISPMNFPLAPLCPSAATAILIISRFSESPALSQVFQEGQCINAHRAHPFLVFIQHKVSEKRNCPVLNKPALHLIIGIPFIIISNSLHVIAPEVIKKLLLTTSMLTKYRARMESECLQLK